MTALAALAAGSWSWCCWSTRWLDQALALASRSSASASSPATEWNAVTDKFGALDLIWGTLVTSVVALLIAVPMAIAIACS